MINEKKKVSEEELVGEFQKYYDRNGAYKLLKKLRKMTKDKPKLISGPTGMIVKYLGHLMSALENPALPPAKKALIIGAIGYIVLPFDLIPDATPVVGFSDDVLSVIGVVHMVSAYSSFSLEELDKEIEKEGK